MNNISSSGQRPLPKIQAGTTQVSGTNKWNSYFRTNGYSTRVTGRVYVYSYLRVRSYELRRRDVKRISNKEMNHQKSKALRLIINFDKQRTACRFAVAIALCQTQPEWLLLNTVCQYGSSDVHQPSRSAIAQRLVFVGLQNGATSFSDASKTRLIKSFKCTRRKCMTSVFFSACLLSNHYEFVTFVCLTHLLETLCFLLLRVSVIYPLHFGMHIAHTAEQASVAQDITT